MRTPYEKIEFEKKICPIKSMVQVRSLCVLPKYQTIHFDIYMNCETSMI